MSPATPRVPTVSVIVPCRDEERYIARCLDSIAATDYPRERLEVLAVDGVSEDRTRAIVADYGARYPFIRLLDNPGRIPPTAVNTGIRAARGEILVRVDAHGVYPPNYIPALVAALEQTGADSVGGVLVTLPANDTAIAQGIAIAMSHPFGVGNSYFRVGVREPRWVDTIAFFCCRRETFDRVGLFDETLARDEDSEFNGRLIQAGGRILLVPHVTAHYYARDSLWQLARMYHQYGYSKPLVARKLGRVTTVRQLVPAGFVTALAAATLALPWVPGAAALLVAAVVPYLVAVAACAIGAGLRRGGLRTVAALGLAFPIVHFSYGLGFLQSALKSLLGSGRPAPPVEMPQSR